MLPFKKDLGRPYITIYNLQIIDLGVTIYCLIKQVIKTKQILIKKKKSESPYEKAVCALFGISTSEQLLVHTGFLYIKAETRITITRNLRWKSGVGWNLARRNRYYCKLYGLAHILLEKASAECQVEPLLWGISYEVKDCICIQKVFIGCVSETRV